jgi:UDP-2-acetamido-2,6-beta-L-arabino-hexul-4-ose reductase
VVIQKLNMKIGITGHTGFIGSHLKNFLNLKEGFEVIPIADDYFDDIHQLELSVKECDAIVHLAAINRHNDPQYIYQKNVELVEKLIAACEKTEAKPHILFSSSTQEEKDNEFGNSKKAGRELLGKWAASNGGIATGMIVPNVFGPFGRPYYNSVVATFCHQLTHGETPSIQVDGSLTLVYINELVEDIFQIIQSKTAGKVIIQHRYEMKVSKILEHLQAYKSEYFDKGVFPDISTSFQLALFNTFRCYVPHDHYPFPFKLNTDNRGTFVEIARTGSSGQFSYSTTKPDITRGNHFHTRKAERFAVIKGKAKISLRKVDSDEIINYVIDGSNPAFVDMPIWHTHNITNIGDEELITLFWINEPYNETDPDTYFVNV